MIYDTSRIAARCVRCDANHFGPGPVCPACLAAGDVSPLLWLVQASAGQQPAGALACWNCGQWREDTPAAMTPCALCGAGYLPF